MTLLLSRILPLTFALLCCDGAFRGGFRLERNTCQSRSQWINDHPAWMDRSARQRKYLDTSLHVSSGNDDDSNQGSYEVTRNDDQTFKLAYRVVRPKSVSSLQAAPIVVLHGGPSVPSDYLYPLEQVIPYRSIIFYDQLGCGRSEEPKDASLYSIENAVVDLEGLLKKLGVRRFHLYGQSFGGILAYEYLKRQATTDSNEEKPDCLSVVLSSTPSDTEQVEDAADDLIRNLLKSGDVEIDDLEDTFRKEHQCRTPTMPLLLMNAYAHAGTTWRGTKAVADYVAKPPKLKDGSRLPSCMILRGEHDFVTPSCIETWKNEAMWGHSFIRVKELEGCSHHGLLEQPTLYGDTLESFMAECD